MLHLEEEDNIWQTNVWLDGTNQIMEDLLAYQEENVISKNKMPKQNQDVVSDLWAY